MLILILLYVLPALIGLTALGIDIANRRQDRLGYSHLGIDSWLSVTGFLFGALFPVFNIILMLILVSELRIILKTDK